MMTDGVCQKVSTSELSEFLVVFCWIWAENPCFSVLQLYLQKTERLDLYTQEGRLTNSANEIKLNSCEKKAAKGKLRIRVN